MKSVEAINRDIRGHEDEIRRLISTRQEAVSRSMLRCKGCKKKTRVQKVCLIIAHWWDRSDHEWRETDHIIWDCPKCRARDQVEREMPFIEEQEFVKASLDHFLLYEERPILGGQGPKLEAIIKKIGTMYAVKKPEKLSKKGRS